MRLTLPWPLRRFLLGALLCSVTMASAASGAEFVVDASQATDPSGNVYRTLQELSSSGALSSGDTVILCNDDSSLTSALKVAVHFRSNDPEVSRTIDLAGLSSSGLYDYSQFPTGEKLELNSIILCNANTGVFFISTKLTSISSEYGVVFDSNTSGYIYGGAICNLIYPISVGAGAVFTGNYASSNSGNARGGVFITATIVVLSPSGPNHSFIKNFVYSGSADAYGGVIYSDGDISFSDGATFINNYAKTSGGAITMGGKCDLLALTKDVLFSGNMVGGVVIGQSDDGFPVVENGIANAIDMNGSLFSSLYTPNLTLAAEEGIVFSGELYQGEDTHLAASRYNNFCADTTLYGGVLLLEHDVVFGRNPEEIMDKRYNSSLTVEKGVLEITGGSTANASSFTLSGPGAVLRPGESAFINTHNADLSHGFTFDMRYQLQAGPAFGPGLMLSALETFTAGGYIGVADTEANAPWFYADRSWKQDRVFHVLTDVQHIHEGDFDGAVSQATGTARVDDPYAYTGTWSHRWTDADGDGYAEQLQLVWKADGTPISRVDPELAGELAVNSLWSSASNAAALGGNVLSRLSVPRLTDRHARNLWGMGLGDFARQRSRGGVDGYDYNGGGYSVGADSGMGGEDEGIWGIAFGQLCGHARSRDFQGRNTQDTRMGSLYWGRLMEESNRAYWIFKGSLTWAETRNNMTSRLSGAPASTGKWNNETWLAQAEVSRTAGCARGWRLTPFVRMEFTYGRQDAFREQGGYGRDFGGAALKRLSIPVGLEIGRTDEWKGRPWAQSLRVSYVGDVLRDVPEATVYSPYSDMGWRGRAVSPERHGLRAEYNTFLQCNERWSVYGGYGLEVRGSSCYHRVNAGVSRSF